jgi:hypothetical protein
LSLSNLLQQINHNKMNLERERGRADGAEMEEEAVAAAIAASVSQLSSGSSGTSNQPQSDSDSLIARLKTWKANEELMAVITDMGITREAARKGEWNR